MSESFIHWPVPTFVARACRQVRTLEATVSALEDDREAARRELSRAEEVKGSLRGQLDEAHGQAHQVEQVRQQDSN